MGVVLRVTSGPHEGQEHLLDHRGLVVVGRSSQAGFSMQEDRLLSREHFVIELDSSLCSLKDLGSTNGTKVNGLRMEAAPLRDGDVITAGDSAFIVQLDHPSRTDHLPPTRCAGCGHALRGEEQAEAASSDLALCASCLEK